MLRHLYMPVHSAEDERPQSKPVYGKAGKQRDLRKGHLLEETSQLYILCGSGSKVFAYSVGDPGSIPGSGKSPGEGNGNPLQYFCLENPMD